MAAAPRVRDDDVITDVTSTFLIGLDDEECPDVSAHVASYVGNVDRLRSILARVRIEMMRQPRIFLAFFFFSPGFRIRIDLMRIRIRIRIQHFF
jgi:hypothetical protein